MSRFVAVLAAALLLGVVLAAPGTPATKMGRQLYGTVGPGFTIHLQEGGPGGAQVTTLEPGIYWLTVADLSTFHNFHLFGNEPRTAALNDVVTTVPFTGTVTVKILLKQGTYVFQCDPHSAIMHGSFTVAGADDD